MPQLSKGEAPWSECAVVDACFCSVPDCLNPARRRGLCWGHLQAKRDGRELGELNVKLEPWERLVQAAIEISNVGDDDTEWRRARQRLRLAAIRYVRNRR